MLERIGVSKLIKTESKKEKSSSWTLDASYCTHELVGGVSIRFPVALTQAEETIEESFCGIPFQQERYSGTLLAVNLNVGIMVPQETLDVDQGDALFSLVKSKHKREMQDVVFAEAMHRTQQGKPYKSLEYTVTKDHYLVTTRIIVEQQAVSCAQLSYASKELLPLVIAILNSMTFNPIATYDGDKK